jgi:alpha-N-arabinofuranosidase
MCTLVILHQVVPGLPVVRTRDFTTWEVLPSAIDAAALPDLRDHGCDDGLYAPGLRHDGRRWWILTILWTDEREGSPIPPAYLPRNA